MPPRMKDEAVEKARRALQAFRGLQPTLNAYARMLTGRMDIVVEASATDNGSTDNKKIYYRPPISLGEKIPHRRHLCDKRDTDGLMRCPSCAQREKVLVTIYHEIAHIWFDSFAKVTDEAKARAIKAAVDERGDKYSQGVAEKIRYAGARVAYMGLAGLISPFLPILLNALEDARVNRALFHALPGTKAMFDANTAYIFECGVEQASQDGDWERELWRDRPLNMQAMIGIFCMASGYNFSDWLDPFVTHHLADTELVGLVRQLDDATSVDTSFTLAYPILVRLRELGFFRTEEDPEDDYQEPPPPPPAAPEQDDEPEEEEPESDGDNEADPEPGDGDGDDDGEADEADAGGGDDSEPADDDGSGDESGPGDGGEQDASAGEGDDEVDEGGDDDSVGSDADEDAEPSDGGGGPESGSDGPEGSDEDPDESDVGGSAGAGDSDAGPDEAGEADDEVREDVPADHDADGSEPGADDSDSDGTDDGNGTGQPDVDGLPSEDLGEPVDDESGHRGSDTLDDDSDGGASEGSGDELSEDPEALDTGEYTHGTRVEGDTPPPPKPDIEWGDAKEVEIVVAQLGDHEAPTSVEAHHHDDDDEAHTHLHRSDEDEKGDEVLQVVIIQDMYFEKPSMNVSQVNVHKEGDKDYFDGENMSHVHRVRYGLDLPEGQMFDPDESVVGPAVMRGRVVFAENRRARHEHNQRRGRVHGQSLARKAPFNDDKLFSQRRLPGRTDYLVGIGVDCSGSAIGKNIVLAKQVAFAEAEMLGRLGIPFFMYAHTGDMVDWSRDDLSLEMYQLKELDEPWNEVTRNRLRKLGARNCNLDGHTFSFYRKILEKHRATTKILHYYTDGAMPAENYDEELEVLRDELARYKRLGIHVTGVGINTDSPKQHGLDTVEVRQASDVIKVVDNLERKLR